MCGVSQSQVQLPFDETMPVSLAPRIQPKRIKKPLNFLLAITVSKRALRLYGFGLHKSMDRGIEVLSICPHVWSMRLSEGLWVRWRQQELTRRSKRTPATTVM